MVKTGDYITYGVNRIEVDGINCIRDPNRPMEIIFDLKGDIEFCGNLSDHGHNHCLSGPPGVAYYNKWWYKNNPVEWEPDSYI